MCKCRAIEHLGNSYYKCMKCDRIFDKSYIEWTPSVWEGELNAQEEEVEEEEG
jgi:hypothetical protein